MSCCCFRINIIMASITLAWSFTMGVCLYAHFSLKIHHSSLLKFLHIFGCLLIHKFWLQSFWFSQMLWSSFWVHFLYICNIQSERSTMHFFFLSIHVFHIVLTPCHFTLSALSKNSLPLVLQQLLVVLLGQVYISDVVAATILQDLDSLLWYFWADKKWALTALMRIYLLLSSKKKSQT